MHEYGWNIAYTLQTPLVQCFALYAAIDARYGNDPKGPTYLDKELFADLENARAANATAKP
jgi:hypothetical protein